MTKKLEVVSNFDPAGTQPEAIKSLVSGIDNGCLLYTSDAADDP